MVGKLPEATAVKPQPRRALEELRRDAARCRACPLWEGATQTVFGEGPTGAPLMLVGEQPGDKEDLAGHPFVGPAGTVLQHALEEAEIDSSAVYMTNAVKHFKYRQRGTRRIHQRPTVAEMKACRPWLQAELDTVEPEVVVGLGATAAHALMGRATPIGEHRGRLLEAPLYSPVLLSAHPSSILRERDSAARAAARAALVADLRVAAAAAGVAH